MIFFWGGGCVNVTVSTGVPWSQLELSGHGFPFQEHGLLHGASERQRYYNSYERQKRHAESKKLRKLKREQKNQGVKRKILKLEEDVVRTD